MMEIKYTATRDLYNELDDAYKAMFSAHTYSNGSGTLTFLSGIYTIPVNTFGTFSWITSMDIPEGVVSIGPAAFKGCETLEKIVLPKGMRSVGIDAFGNDTINELYCYAIEPPELAEHIYLNILVMYVPEESYDAYNDSDWGNWVSEFRIIPNPPTYRYGIDFSGMKDMDYRDEIRDSK